MPRSRSIARPCDFFDSSTARHFARLVDPNSIRGVARRSSGSSREAEPHASCLACPPQTASSPDAPPILGASRCRPNRSIPRALHCALRRGRAGGRRRTGARRRSPREGGGGCAPSARELALPTGCVALRMSIKRREPLRRGEWGGSEEKKERVVPGGAAGDALGTKRDGRSTRRARPERPGGGGQAEVETRERGGERGVGREGGDERRGKETKRKGTERVEAELDWSELERAVFWRRRGSGALTSRGDAGGLGLFAFFGVRPWQRAAR